MGNCQKPLIYLTFSWQLLFFAACSSESKFSTPSDDDWLGKPNAIVKTWQKLAPFCNEPKIFSGFSAGFAFPAKAECDDGDSTLFNGLLCIAGNNIACDAVKEAQDAEGRFWRSPRRRLHRNFGEPNSFSRDMATGVLFYLAKTKDVDAAKNWLDWIEDNRPCLLSFSDESRMVPQFNLSQADLRASQNVTTNSSSHCTIKSPLYRYCRDDENQICTITPGMWAHMNLVWKYLGLPSHPMMQQYEDYFYNLGVLEVMLTPPGYQTHLKSLHSWLHLLLNPAQDEPYEYLLDIWQGNDPNPFFDFLTGTPGDEIRNKLYAMCPVDRMQTSRRQWAWERQTPSNSIKNSMLWDCLFLYSLSLGPINAL